MVLFTNFLSQDVYIAVLLISIYGWSQLWYANNLSHKVAKSHIYSRSFCTAHLCVKKFSHLFCSSLIPPCVLISIIVWGSDDSQWTLIQVIYELNIQEYCLPRHAFVWTDSRAADEHSANSFSRRDCAVYERATRAAWWCTWVPVIIDTIVLRVALTEP